MPDSRLTRPARHRAGRRDLLALIVIVIMTMVVFRVPRGAAAITAAADGGAILVDDFEDVSDWSGLRPEQTIVRVGSGAGRWDDHLATKMIIKRFPEPLDVSSAGHLQFWMYSAQANGAKIELILDSNNEADDSGWDYYIHRIVVDWAGWRLIRVRLDEFHVARRPLGWSHINYVRFSASGWGHEPMADTDLVLDQMLFAQGVLEGVRTDTSWRDGDFAYKFTLSLVNKAAADRDLALTVEPEDGGSPLRWQLADPSLTLPLGGQASTEVTVTVPADYIEPETWLEEHRFELRIAEGESVVDGTTLTTAVPLPPRDRPRLLLDVQDLARIADWTERYEWAASVRDGIVAAADSWPEAYEKRYELETWELPPEGGQWSGWYICPDKGVRLRFEGPGRHVCPVDGKVYSGWPYDQVMYSWMHGHLARSALDLGLAYRLTGEGKYAESAVDILRAYGDKYLEYPIHNVQGDPGGSGAHVLSQTLDEAIWLISMAWAYDLVADSPALGDADRIAIEHGLLRPAAQLIGRNHAGQSNWQSWHNAALAAVGFELEDPVLVAQAMLDESNGFEFQMTHSVSADGFWYEGSWGYHFFALHAHQYLAEMAVRAGLDPYGQSGLRAMFSAPLEFSMPDLTLPPFNDSGTVNLVSQDYVYESAYNRYRDQHYAAVLGHRARRREALFWGAEEVPQGARPTLGSTLFPDAGYAVLRSGGSGAGRPAPSESAGSQEVYAALDFGPHGGWHGHFDKLGFVLQARGTVMAVDPGTQSYAAPTHKTWDKVTVAHNTVVVDERTQDEATGHLHRFAALPGLSMAAADAGDAAPGADLLRTLLVSPEYVLDRFRVRTDDEDEHTFDWLYHGFGQLSTDLPLSEYPDLPDGDGYQHISDAAAATTSADWQVRFDEQPPLGEPYGGVWANHKSIGASFTVSDEQAAAGNAAGKLTYDFSAQSGYIVFSTERPEQVTEPPTELRLAIFGDASGNELTLRVYDSTNERYLHRLGVVDWSGWRVITATDVVSWTHFQGDDDGVFDPPVPSVAVQIGHKDGAAESGALYVDDIVLRYPSVGDSLVEDFEHVPVGLRLWMLAPPSQAGGGNTTVVTGKGLGPNLLVPVPLAMARRTGRETVYTALMEPLGEEPLIRRFSRVSTSAVSEDEALAAYLATDTFEDLVLAVADGPSGRSRSFGAAVCDGVLCLVRSGPDGAPLRLVLVKGGSLEADGRQLLVSPVALAGLQVDYLQGGRRIEIASSAPLTQPLRLLAPEAETVDVNGVPAVFYRQGDFVVLGPRPPLFVPAAFAR